MKLCYIATIALLLFAFCSLGLGESSRSPKQCCFSYVQARLPKKVVVGYTMTHYECAKSAVVFSTVKEKQFCADPTKTWVRDLMNYLDGIELTTGSGDSSSSPTTMAPSKH